MKDVKIFPGFLKGEVKVPPSKSLCHRAIIAASLAQGQSVVDNVVLSEDILATIQGVQALGAEVIFQQNKLVINGCQLAAPNNCIIDCNESGSTLRFLIPLGLRTENIITYRGVGNLGNRPLDPYLEIFKEQDILYSNDKLPISVSGILKPGTFNIKGNISSQFVTGLMFALPLLDGDSTIFISGPLESKGYIDLTIDILSSFGIFILNNNYQSFFIKGRQEYKPRKYTVEGDYSQAAFWLAAGVLGSDISCLELKQSSKQGDKFIINILKSAGAEFEMQDAYLKALPTELQAFKIDVSQYPDLAPILTVVAALSKGTSRITGAGRLRMKECDRLRAITAELNKLGAVILEENDSLTVRGSASLAGGHVDSWGDHRIAMALAIAATKCSEPVIIHNSKAVNKSYPNFFEDYNKLGGNLHEWNLG
ncbi:MAG TPA: 3-phosphoshikimate 1-carboxyvinyltransferase [Patescibacteria group bacterium]|nr:3-phosphoshikimate 1-carboxyvinyltransferase [Patescibacteria group bacterium]